MKKKKPYGKVIHPTEDEVLERWSKELNERIDSRVSELSKDKGVIFWARIHTELGEKFRVQEK